MMLTCFLFYLILGATRVVQVSSRRDSFIAIKSLKSSEQLASLENLKDSWMEELTQGYRSMLNVPVILVGLADHARLVNTYIPSLDWYYNIDVFVCTCTSHGLEEKWVTTFICDVLHVILLYWPYSVRTSPVPTGRTYTLV